MDRYPQFVSDRLYYAMHKELAELDQTQAMLKNLKQVFEITTRHYDRQSELIHAILEAGTQIFELDTGIVSKIEGDDYHVLDVISPLEGLSPGVMFDVDGTYCREVVRSGKVLGFPHVGELSFMKDHPVYQNMQLESYLSAPIWVDDRIAGTLNFTSKHPRNAGFSQHERDLIILMSNAIATFMLVRDRESKLNLANQRLKRFVGYVAHDLRNPLGTILSLVKRISQPATSAERREEIMNSIQTQASTALDFVYSILELSALGAGKIDPVVAPTPLLPILQAVEVDLEELRALTRNDLVLACADDISVQADPGLLKQVITNLCSNALKYAPARSEITISAMVDMALCCVTIRNPNRGGEEDISDHDLYRSYGFGLEIAEELLNAHDSELELEDSPEWFTARFSLPLVQPDNQSA